MERAPLAASPGKMEALRLEPATGLAVDRKALAILRDLGGRGAAERALAAQQRDRLEQVGLALRVLAGDDGRSASEGNGLREEVAKAVRGDLGQAQRRSDHRRIGITTY
jgi:hypothetical protein